MNTKTSSDNMATKASKVLKSNQSSYIQKSLAASVLSQKALGKVTSEHMEAKASMVLQSDKYSATTKSLAASVLSQSEKR